MAITLVTNVNIEQGVGEQKVTEEPDKDLLSRAEAGDAEAQNDVGKFYSQDGREPQARLWFQRAADLGLPKAKHNLGVIAFEKGLRDEAVTWFSAAAQDGWLNSVAAIGAIREQEGDAAAAIELYEKAANQGHAESQDSLARLAFDLDTDEGHERALHWSELAAKQGHIGAHARLARIFHEGRGVARDSKRAVELWRVAAEAGHSGSQVMIGNAYIVGVGVPVDRVKGAYFLILGVKQGDEAAVACLRRLLRELTPEETQQVEEIGQQLDYPLWRFNEPDPDLLARAEAGDAQAQTLVGQFYARKGADEQRCAIAATWFQRAADQGHLPAMQNLGLLAHHFGRHAEANAWFMTAAKGGHMPAILSLGTILENSDRVPEAIRMFQAAADLGDPEGQDALGRLAFAGDGSDAHEQARTWSELAAAQGNADAHARLGTIYHEGLGVERDPKRAAEHWLAAADAGHLGAQLMIGKVDIVLARMTDDRVWAAHFLISGARQGSELANACLQRLLRELTPEEMERVWEIGRRLDFSLQRFEGARDAQSWLHRLRGLWGRSSS